MSTDELDSDGVWVVSDVAPDGTYVVSLHVTDDIAVTLDRDRALAYAAMVADAITRAEYDASVFRQQCAAKVPAELVASVIGDLRQDRPPLPDLGLPLTFEPFVSGRTMAPGLYVSINGERVGQWTDHDAHQHAGHVLQVLAGVDLDAAYWRYLTGTLGLDDGKARAMVGELARHRDGTDG